MNETKDMNKSSFTIGSAAKDCAIKVYLDFETMDDDTIKKLIKKGIGAWKVGREVSGR